MVNKLIIILKIVVYIISALFFALAISGACLLMVEGMPIAGIFLGLLGVFFMLSMTAVVFPEEDGPVVGIDEILDSSNNTSNT